MNKNIIGVGVAAIAVIAIVGVVVANKPDSVSSPSSSSSSSSSQTDQKDSTPNANASSGKEDLTTQTEVAMDIKEFAFVKKDITIKKGTTVTWTNQDEAKHNVVSKQDGGPKGEDLLKQGESYSFTFDTIGTFNYLCEPHPYMKGIVNVVE
ncbi:MAG: plastocyanin/azurin family copper-binding protein [Candidatus Saccharimonadales bacterium]